MEVQLSENQAGFIKKIAKDEGFTDFQVKTTSGSCRGDNYLGVIVTVSVKNHHRQLELILKAALESEELRKVVPIRKTFLREMYLYKTVLPEFQEFEREQGFLEGFTAYAKLYGAFEKDLEEFLVLENLKSTGYDLWNRRIPMTAHHLEAVLIECGKFHAVSFAMKEKNPERFEDLSKELTNVFVDMVKNQEHTAIIQSVLKNGTKAVEGDQFASEAFERFANIAEDFVLDIMTTPVDHSVILHGDTWCNNLLFKYEGEQRQKPSKVCFIDWQISWVNTPVIDLAYFFLTSASKENLSNYKKFLKIYHDSLSDSLRKLNCDPETLFSFATLQDHWQKYAKFGVYMALTLLKLMLSDGNEVPDMSEIADTGKSFAEGFSFETVHNDEYNKRIFDLVTVAAENNWI